MTTKSLEPLMAVIEARMGDPNLAETYLKSKRTFDDVLRAFGYSREVMQTLSEREEDQIQLPVDPSRLRICNSGIHGKGVFASSQIHSGEVIALARIRDKRTPVGRYCNHGADPNCVAVMENSGDVYFVAIKNIEPESEILSDYVMNFVNTRMPGMVMR